MADGIVEHFEYEPVRQWFAVAGIADVSGISLSMLPDFVHEFGVELRLQRSSLVMFGFFELRMRAMQAGEIADFSRVDQELGRERGLQAIVESIRSGEFGAHVC